MSSDTRIPFIVDLILPSREVHLIAGPSGAGKTTLMFQLIEQWSAGKEVFGHASHPQPFCYISCDRSQASTARTLKRVGLSLDIPTISLAEDRSVTTIQGAVNLARRTIPGLRVLFIDAIAVLVKDGKTSDYAIVADFLRECAAICVREDITVIALVHAAKVKEGEKFLNPRQRILGSVAWAGFSDTVILIEPANPEDPTDDERSVLVLPRNAPAEEFVYGFNEQGRLEQHIIIESAFRLLNEKLLPCLDPNKVYLFSELWIAASDAGVKVSKKTMRRWLAELIYLGKMEQPKKGSYKLTKIQ